MQKNTHRVYAFMVNKVRAVYHTIPNVPILCFIFFLFSCLAARGEGETPQPTLVF